MAGPRAEYDFAPGLTYLNTASLGPTARGVVIDTIKVAPEDLPGHLLLRRGARRDRNLLALINES